MSMIHASVVGSSSLIGCPHAAFCSRRPNARIRMAVRVQAQLSQDELKQQAAWKAVDYVKSGMILGLGTGSTAAFAVDRIGDLLESGELKDIIGVPTSVRTYEQAKGGRRRLLSWSKWSLQRSIAWS